MVYTLTVFAAGLAFAAWKAQSAGARLGLVLLALLNVACAVKMIHDGYPYAFRLEPQRTAPGISDDPKPWIP